MALAGTAKTPPEPANELVSFAAFSYLGPKQPNFHYMSHLKDSVRAALGNAMPAEPTGAAAVGLGRVALFSPSRR